MEHVRKFRTEEFKYEYGLDAVRTFPWQGIAPPFAGGHCIVRPGEASLDHVNSPSDEDEMFIVMDGEAVVVLDGVDHPVSRGDLVAIPRGISHYVRNDSSRPFHFFTIWWNRGNVEDYLAAERESANR